ncbi:MAG: PBP1A family penicillin-binding protein [Bacilli bacterium]|nr:PBP1A family penicillin-binding protein [Bacilli bacterium]
MKFLRTFIKLGTFLFIAFVVCIIGLYTYAFFSPKLELKTANRFFLYDNNDMLVYQGSGNSEWVDFEDISPNLVNAVISVEDKNFYKHQGFDYLRIAQAMITNIKNKSIVQGASTISQQYIKNMYLDFAKTWDRKIEEAFLTLELEVHYDKEDILEGYLNTINYGQGNYGIANASQYYFNKKPSELTLEEAIMLAGIPKSPNKYNPVSNYDACIERAKIVAKSMVNNSYINNDTFNNLFLNPISIYGKSKESNLQTLMYYQDAVLAELENLVEIPGSLIESGGLKIYTNLDLEAQSALEDSVKKYIENDSMQVSSIVIDPNSGGVLALTGGKDYSKSQYNRAIQAKRQVGSTMKPFLYYAALENNMVSSSTFTSEATTFSLSNGKNYTPSNFADRYANKNITMTSAIAMSDNVFAVKTNLFLGPEVLVEASNRMGITGELLAVPSLALGTSELTLLDFARGYTTLASGGYKKEVHFIKRIEDLEGNILYEVKNQNNLVLNPNYTYILNEMLTSTTNPVYTDYTKPTAMSIAAKLSRKYAIKTGTTTTDFWTVGYNPDILMLVWAGHDDNQEVSSSKSTITKNIWADTVETILKDKEIRWYDTPQNVVGVALDAISGKPTNDAKRATIFYYVKGSENYVFKEEEKE